MSTDAPEGWGSVPLSVSAFPDAAALIDSQPASGSSVQFRAVSG